MPGVKLLESDGVSVLRAERLDLRYRRGGNVLSGVNLEVRRGDFWCLLGSNGSGKSTFLKAVLGIVRPSSGSLEVIPELASRRRVGFVPQRCEVRRTLPMCVEEFVLLGLTGTGLRTRDAWPDIDWALERVGVGALRRRDYWSLSGGQRQRALVARALVRRPSILILDEPTTGLDMKAERSVFELVGSLAQEEGITILLVTHSVALASQFGSHIAFFQDGKVATGPAAGMLRPEAIMEVFDVSRAAAVALLGPYGGAREPGGESAGDSAIDSWRAQA